MRLHEYRHEIRRVLPGVRVTSTFPTVGGGWCCLGADADGNAINVAELNGEWEVMPRWFQGGRYYPSLEEAAAAFYLAQVKGA